MSKSALVVQSSGSKCLVYEAKSCTQCRVKSVVTIPQSPGWF